MNSPEALNAVCAGSVCECESCTVLLVDDERPVRRVVARMLDRLGCRVIEAEDGEKALAAFGEGPDRVDAVVTDLVMPRLGGRALMERLRGVRPELPFMVMTGYDPSGVGVREGDGTVLLRKPFRPEEFGRGLNEALRRA